ncbi:MAG: transcriptional regulator [Pseudomonadales bacterium]|nr:transcriptional regulator [Pseudomonadales bacterium]
MDKFDRFQLLHRLFRSHRRPIPLSILAEKLECSQKTVKRAIDAMRDYLDAPLTYYPEQNGWQYDENAGLYELPGLWLTSSELQSLALLLQVLDTIGEGLLGEELALVERHITKLLEARGIARNDFDNHIKILPLNKRSMPGPVFSAVCESLIQRQCIKIDYISYAKRRTNRTISPQTLVYYRENWYLDAWCHMRNALRTFSLSRIHSVTHADETFATISPGELYAHFAEGYGIFAGKAPHIAILRFHPEIARDISTQQWHPSQVAEWDGDYYVLHVPYSSDQELIQDILRYTPNVSVEAPASLRQAVEARLSAGLKLYK